MEYYIKQPFGRADYNVYFFEKVHIVISALTDA